MQTKDNFIAVLIVVCLITLYVDGIDPVCFNCHCSSYELDRSIRCKNAIIDKTAYFKLWTENMTVVVGSDIVLAVELKEHANDYCWCTSAKLEWNGLLQNSSGRLLTIHIVDATKTEAGYYWAVLYLDGSFFFSKPVSVNVTGSDEGTVSPPIEVDPKIGAIVVGVLFVVIMIFGISIHCLKLHKKSVRERTRKKLDNFELARTEPHVPLAWKLQDPANTIQESYAEHPLIASDFDEEGSVSTKSADLPTSCPASSQSLSSDVEKSKTPVTKAVEAVQENWSPYTSTKSIPLQIPIKDDRFTNQRSWYKSLNTEVVSESLLSNKEHEAKKAAKKQKESLGLYDKSLAQGLLMCTDITSDRLDRLKEAHKYMTSTGYTYGRSLPMPQPAGARPTVMTIFPTTSPRSRLGGATIHTSHPEKRRHVKNLFTDDSTTTMSRNRSVSSQVQFTNTNLSKRYKSEENLDLKKRSDSVPKKSNLKNNGLSKNPSESSSPDYKKSVSPRDKGPQRTISVPQLGLTPASPTTPSRFTVKMVDSKEKLDGTDKPSPFPSDPLSQLWDFSSDGNLTNEYISGSKSNSVQRMDHLRVPGQFEIPIILQNQNLEGYWST